MPISDAASPGGSPYSRTSTGDLFDLDTYQVKTVVVQLYGTFVGTVVYETTVNGTNWLPVTGVTAAGTNIAADYAASDTAAALRAFPALGRRFRARVSAYTSGTPIAAVLFRDN